MSSGNHNVYTTTVIQLTLCEVAGLAARFWPKVDKEGPVHPDLATPCWVWTAAKSNNGYGRIWLGWSAWPRNAYAHRASFYLASGYFPPEHTDHLCRNRACVNPAHLEAVPPVVNIQRARPLVCKNGHPLSGDNLFVGRDRTRVYPLRRCRTCVRANSALHAADRKERKRERRQWHPKITDAQVSQMKALVASGMSRGRAAEQFGISRTYVTQIMNGTRRKYPRAS